MKIIQEFKEFALKGNAFELAIGVIIGAAFGKIVSSLVGDVIMPPLGLLIGGVNFTSFKLTLKDSYTDSSGKIIEAVTLNYGNFLQTAFDFFIIALAIFIAVKIINSLRRKVEKQVEKAEPTEEVEILKEIRDILKAKS